MDGRICPCRFGWAWAIAAVLVGAVFGSFSLVAARAEAGFSFARESLWGAAILLIPGLAMFGVGAIYSGRRSGLLMEIARRDDGTTITVQMPISQCYPISARR